MNETDIKSISTERAVVIGLSAPIPIAYLNIYEEGDMWIKTQGCEACEDTFKCCGNCELLIDGQCGWQTVRRPATSRKPWNCIVKPYPDASMPFCALEFKCVRGVLEGQVRRVRDSGYIFQTG
jgi:hypothetical protein